MKTSPSTLLLSLALLASFTNAIAQPKSYKSYADWISKCPDADKFSKNDDHKILNRQKNREDDPESSDYTQDFTWANILQSGEDEDRFDDTKAAEIVGYVIKIVPGGLEACNCRAAKNAKNKNYRDTHIELVQTSGTKAKSKRLVVEVSPRVRHNKGWTTLTENDPMFYNKWVKVKGWLTYDFLHRGNAKNTANSNGAIHRATVWEIHPITSIEVVPEP